METSNISHSILKAICRILPKEVRQTLAHILTLAPIAGVLALVFVAYLAFHIARQDSVTERMKDIAEAIREGVMAYLSRQYRTLAVFVITVAILLMLALDYRISIAYVAGSICSVLAGFIGMRVAVLANV